MVILQSFIYSLCLKIDSGRKRINKLRQLRTYKCYTLINDFKMLQTYLKGHSYIFSILIGYFLNFRATTTKYRNLKMYKIR